MKTNDTLLYCRSCKRLINSEVDECPQCGARDPFFGKKIFSAKIYPALICGFVIIIFGHGFYANIFGLHSSTHQWLAWIVAIILAIIGFRICKNIFGNKTYEEAEKQIQEICDDEYDMEALMRWREYINKRLSFTDE